MYSIELFRQHFFAPGHFWSVAPNIYWKIVQHNYDEYIRNDRIVTGPILDNFSISSFRLDSTEAELFGSRFLSISFSSWSCGKFLPLYILFQIGLSPPKHYGYVLKWSHLCREAWIVSLALDVSPKNIRNFISTNLLYK